MIAMSQLASHRANTAPVGDDLCVSHNSSVRSCVREINENMYASNNVSFVRAPPHKAGMADETLGARLKALQIRSGRSYEEIAKAAGLAGRSSVQRYFSADFDGPLSLLTANNLAKGFAGSKVDPAEIWALTGIPMPNVAPAPTARLETDRRDIPVYGTALGAPLDFDGFAIEQTELDQGEVINYFTRPAALRGRTDVYGVYIQGASMAPRFQEGEVAFVDPKRPPQVGDDVLVFIASPEDDGERITACLIKRLVRRTAGYIELEQFNPGHAFRIDSGRVSKVHRVIPWAELLA